MPKGLRRHLILTAAMATAALIPAAARAAEATKHPNVLVIVADDLGYADIGAQAIVKDVRTPNIDSIASAGVRFTSGYVSCPVCSPSRAGFLTGRYQERFGHEMNPLPEVEKGSFGLPTDQVTIADEMKRAGYATGIIGKWHEGHFPQYLPQKRGFDEFYGFLGGAHPYIAPGQGINQIRRGDTPVDEKEYLTDAITREAVSFIDRHHENPFFLYVAYNAVHTPQQAPPRYRQRFPDVKDQSRMLMLAMLSAEDDGVGKILTKLRDLKLEEDTLVVFFSDNGGPTAANASRNSPLHGYKGQVWEGGIRIPFMMQWKGKIPAGKTLDQPVISLDLFPTALAAAGSAPREGLQLDGVNLLPWLESGGQGPGPHHVLYWRFTPQWAVRDGNYKLVHTKEGTQLFDLSKDLSEKTDLTKDQPDIAKKIQAEFDTWNSQLKAPLWPGKQEGEHQGERKEVINPNGSAEKDD